MKFQKNIFFALFTISIFTISCQQGSTVVEDAIINIPSDAASVTAINAEQLMDKADFPAIQKMAFYEDMIQEVSQNDPGIEAILKDPTKSGVDLESNIYITQDFDVNAPENAHYAVVMSLKDKAAFESMITGANNSQVKSGEGFQYIQPSRMTIVSWNDELAVVGISQGFGGNLNESVAKIYSTTKETSVVGNEDLQKCFTKNADIKSWMNSDYMAEAMKGEMGMGLAMAGLTAEMFSNNYSHSYVNFENGEIVGESQYWVNEKLADEFRHIFKDEVKTNFAKYVPKENLAFAFSGALDMKGIKMILDKKGMSGMADFQLKEFGLSMAGLAKTFDGDFMVSGHNAAGKSSPDMMLAVKINDKDNFEKILELGEEYRMLLKTDDGVYNLSGMMSGMTNGLGSQPQLYFDGKMAFIGDASSSISPLAAGNYGDGGTVSGDVKNIINENLMGLFADMSVLGDMLDLPEMESSGMQEATMKMGRDDASFKLEMKDKSTNSLKSLFQWLDKAYEKRGQSM